jgi:hypothetical protein
MTSILSAISRVQATYGSTIGSATPSRATFCRNAKDPLDDKAGPPEGGLVDEHNLGMRHLSAGQAQHVLLAA